MKISNLMAILILSGMFFMMFFSSFNDSATFDEVAHIGAGFSYLTQKDSRLNPEHPPLIKDLSALSLLILSARSGLNFSINQPFWTMENVNDRQWAAGNYLLYESGNDADKILLYSRLPIIILAIIFGFFLFAWTRKNYGTRPAILTLFLFSLSPTILAHSRYVTTDLGAAFAFFLSIIFFVNFLENNNNKSLIYFGIALGVALLVKFSLVIALPFFVIMGVVYSKEKVLFIFKFFGASIVAISVIWLFYIPHIWNYSPKQNLADAHFTLGGYKTAKFAPEIIFNLLSNKSTQPLGQYLHGFLMVIQRTAGGNSAYFLGEVSGKGWISYFPTLFFTKEQVGLYILIVLAIIISLKKFLALGFPKISVKTAIFLSFIAYYWAWSLWSPLNIGIRHILPTLPFIYILISKPIVEWVERKTFQKIFVSILFIYMALEIVFVYPYFLSYYNVFASGWKNGYKIATDSNYDWGQDLKRLKTWIEKNNLSGGDKIYLDYFGGGSPKYYFMDKYEPWRYEKGPPPKGSYFAISANSFLGAEKLYYWLQDKKPLDRAGSSIFIYKF